MVGKMYRTSQINQNRQQLLQIRLGKCKLQKRQNPKDRILIMVGKIKVNRTGYRVLCAIPLGGGCNGATGATGFADVGGNREFVIKVAVLTEPEAL